MKVGENPSWMTQAREGDLMKRKALHEIVYCQIGCTADKDSLAAADELSYDLY